MHPGAEKLGKLDARRDGDGDGSPCSCYIANIEGKQSKKTHYPRQRTAIGLAYLCVLIITQAAPFPSLAERGQ